MLNFAPKVASLSAPISFDFDGNAFGANGLLHYLATHQNGRKVAWQNPAFRNEVEVICSTVAFGQVSDLVGRTAKDVTLRTKNEDKSYLGVEGQYFLKMLSKFQECHQQF